MTPILGSLERHPDGVFTGLFRTLIIRAQIELRPVSSEGGQAYAVFAAPDFHLGEGRQPLNPENAAIELTLRAPELARAVHARAVHREADSWTLYWVDAAETG